jgi:hypothetical protein
VLSQKATVPHTKEVGYCRPNETEDKSLWRGSPSFNLSHHDGPCLRVKLRMYWMRAQISSSVN